MNLILDNLKDCGYSSELFRIKDNPYDYDMEKYIELLSDMKKEEDVNIGVEKIECELEY